MRNLKRALSLALASVMVIGMMVVGASAASYDDFSDKDEIVNKEAVQMLVELGVINGKDDGSYDPTGIVTRAEMAKMICVVLNGGKDPSLGNVTNYSYNDTVGHWAAGYIEYCTQLGIVAGKGDGTFAPNDTVTATEAAKMPLVAMGYKSEVEGFTGSNWAIGVNVRANQKGLYSDLSISVDASLTRDSAAQMVYNALDATVVSYTYTLVTDGSTISSSPTLIDNNNKTLLEHAFNAVKVEGVVIANEYANLSATSVTGSALDEGKTKIVITNDDDQSAYAGTETFAVSTGADELGRSVAIYVKKNSNAAKAEVLGSAITSADNVVVVDYSGDSLKDVADDNDLSYTSKTQIAYNYASMADLTDTTVGSAGYEKIIVDTDDDGDVDYVLYNNYQLGKVTKYSTSSDGSITVSLASGSYTVDDKADVVGFDDVAKDDYVMATFFGGKLYVEAVETVTGTIEAYKNSSKNDFTTKLTIDGTDYSISNVPTYTGTELFAANKAFVDDTATLDTEATFYLDQQGYIVATGEVVESAYNFAYVIESSDATLEDLVKVVLSDGTKATYSLVVQVGGAHAGSGHDLVSAAGKAGDQGHIVLGAVHSQALSSLVGVQSADDGLSLLDVQLAADPGSQHIVVLGHILKAHHVVGVVGSQGDGLAGAVFGADGDGAVVLGGVLGHLAEAVGVDQDVLSIAVVVVVDEDLLNTADGVILVVVGIGVVGIGVVHQDLGTGDIQVVVAGDLGNGLLGSGGDDHVVLGEDGVAQDGGLGGAAGVLLHVQGDGLAQHIQRGGDGVLAVAEDVLVLVGTVVGHVQLGLAGVQRSALLSGGLQVGVLVGDNNALDLHSVELVLEEGLVVVVNEGGAGADGGTIGDQGEVIADHAGVQSVVHHLSGVVTGQAGVHVQSQTGVQALLVGADVHADGPVGAGEALHLGLVAHGHQQHLGSLRAGHGGIGVELAGSVAGHDAQLGAVLDVAGSPVAHGVSVAVGDGGAQAGVLAAVQHDADHLGHLGAGHDPGGIVGAVVLAVDDAQLDEHLNGLFVDDLVLVGEVVIARGAGADDHHANDHDGSQSQAQSPLEVSHLEFLILKFGVNGVFLLYLRIFSPISKV